MLELLFEALLENAKAHGIFCMLFVGACVLLYRLVLKFLENVAAGRLESRKDHADTKEDLRRVAATMDEDRVWHREKMAERLDANTVAMTRHADSLDDNTKQVASNTQAILKCKAGAE